MSSGPSAPAATSSSAAGGSSNSQPKKTTILTPDGEGGPKKPGLFSDTKKIVKAIEIVLTLFYGIYLHFGVLYNFVHVNRLLLYILKRTIYRECNIR